MLAVLLVSGLAVVPVSRAGGSIISGGHDREKAVGHYIGAIRDLREDVVGGGPWGWLELPGGCAVISGQEQSEVVWSRSIPTCNSIAIRSKTSMAALDALLEALESMDRRDPRTLSFARGTAERLIAPLYPERWETIRRAEDLLVAR